MKFGILAVLGVFALAACQPIRKSGFSSGDTGGEIETSGRSAQIFGGQSISKEDPLSEAILELRFAVGGDEKSCSAARILPRVLLTAAHCIVADEIRVLEKGEVIAVVGRSQLKVHPVYQTRKAEIESKEQWKQGNEYDVAMIFLPENLEVKPGIRLFELKNERLGAGDLVSVAGYGWSSYNVLTGERQGSTDLKKTELELKESKQKEILVFSQQEGKGICVGDSGGPAFLQEEKLILVGVASDVRNPGDPMACEGVSRFVKLGSVIPWIQDQLKR